jgi:Pvc16 N-terminal domain
VIHEVDEVLRTLIRTRALPEVISDVEFAAPTRDWAARRNAPTVNLYLYDIREEVARRERGPVPVRDLQGEVLYRRQPPRWYRLSYLVTAWTSRSEDEHRLLSALLVLLLQHEVLPRENLTGALAGLGLSVPMTVAVPPPESRSLADLWSALGGELKPSLDLVVTVPFVASPEYPVGPPVKDITIEVRGERGSPVDVAVRSFRDEDKNGIRPDVRDDR